MWPVTFEWPVDRTCIPLPVLGDTPTGPEQAAYDAALAARNDAEDLAVQVLWALSGRQFGLREVIVRPGRVHGWPCSPWLSLWDGWTWTHSSCGCVGHCGLSSAAVVHLPGPVAEIVRVQIDDQVIAPTGYALEGDRLYRRCDNDCPWPTQNLARPLDEPGTWSVTYKLGYPVPAGVDRLTGLLAKEFMLACDGKGCRIPPTVVATSSKGVSHVFDPSKIIAAGFTGLPEIDRWLQAVNPHRLAAPPEVI